VSRDGQRPADGTGQQQQPETLGATLPAVFGGAKDTPALDAAEQIGYHIGLNHAILLTGGDDPNAGGLKARVLAGAWDTREITFAESCPTASFRIHPGCAGDTARRLTAHA
jgi:hypothetical protein